MYRITHVYIGFVIGLFIGINDIDSLLNGLIGAIGGFIPDIDVGFKHRKTLHNIFVPFTIALSLLITNTYLIPMQWRIHSYNYLISFTLGWILHLVTDSLTIKGVYPLYPLIRNFRLRFAKFRSNSLLINTVMILLASIILGYWFYERNIYTKIDEYLKIVNVFKTLKTTLSMKN
ncbi:MAG: metal-dependent hydrolase [Desulfurococcaceae archaeon]